VVQAALAHVADVHVGALADRLEPFEHLDGVGAVLGAGGVVWQAALDVFQGRTSSCFSQRFW
jgi:hypothetical protein